MEQYASIGKLVLKNAIGLQKNRKEIEYRTVPKLDEKASGCFACPVYSQKQFYANQPESNEYLNACAKCINCNHQVTKYVEEEHVKYINEGNRYATKLGYSETLKANGLKLLIVLHMMHPDRFGYIYNLSISELRDVLGCDRKTVISNLESLKNYDYIDYVKTNQRGYINVSLIGYDSYFKPAREGGRGYMTFSIKLVEALLEIKDLTTLRLFLHQLIDTNNHAETEQKVFKKSYQELRDCLPGYYKPNHIKKGLSGNIDSPIFQLKVGDSVTFILNNEYNAKQVKEELIRDSRRSLRDYVEQLNDKFDSINEKTAFAEDTLPELFWKGNKPARYVNLSVNTNDLEDLAKMCWQFSMYDIMDAINYIYMNYIIPHRMIENLPGLVRTIIPEIRELRDSFKLAA